MSTHQYACPDILIGGTWRKGRHDGHEKVVLGFRRRVDQYELCKTGSIRRCDASFVG